MAKSDDCPLVVLPDAEHDRDSVGIDRAEEYGWHHFHSSLLGGVAYYHDPTDLHRNRYDSLHDHHRDRADTLLDPGHRHP